VRPACPGGLRLSGSSPGQQVGQIGDAGQQVMSASAAQPFCGVGAGQDPGDDPCSGPQSAEHSVLGTVSYRGLPDVADSEPEHGAEHQVWRRTASRHVVGAQRSLNPVPPAEGI